MCFSSFVPIPTKRAVFLGLLSRIDTYTYPVERKPVVLLQALRLLVTCHGFPGRFLRHWAIGCAQYSSWVFYYSPITCRCWNPLAAEANYGTTLGPECTPIVEDEHIWDILDIDPSEQFRCNDKVFLDGSGGKRSRDPRTRVCGWAWVQKPNLPNREWDGRGMYGTLVGPQTVPRSELTALNRLLTFLIPLEEVGTLDVYTDNKAVFDGWNIGPKISHGNLGDLWSLCWDLYDVVKERGWNIALHKVKSHATDEHMALGPSTPELKEGNDLADHWAGEAAAYLAITEQEQELLSWVDGTAWTIQNRLVAICTKYLSKENHEPAPIREGITKRKIGQHLHRTQLTTVLQYVYNPVPGEPNKLACFVCGQQWLKHKCKQFVDRGYCPGPIVWGTPPEIPDQLWRAAPATKVWHNSAELHPTHHLAWQRGLIFCCKCGYYGAGRVVRLTQECRMKPPNLVQKGRLRRLLQGKVPIKGFTWPKPPEAKCPAGLTMWLT